MGHLTPTSIFNLWMEQLQQSIRSFSTIIMIPAFLKSLYQHRNKKVIQCIFTPPCLRGYITLYYFIMNFSSGIFALITSNLMYVSYEILYINSRSQLWGNQYWPHHTNQYQIQCSSSVGWIYSNWFPYNVGKVFILIKYTH